MWCWPLDVFVYIGDLARVFLDVSRVLKAGGVFGFSVEQAAGERDFVLQPVGRFAQSVAYIRRLCSANGLTESESFAQTIRGDPATTAPGYVFLLSKLSLPRHIQIVVCLLNRCCADRFCRRVRVDCLRRACW